MQTAKQHHNIATMAATILYDPFSQHKSDIKHDEATLLLDLLALDQQVDITSGRSSPTTTLLNDLLAVDIEFAKADNREHMNEEKDTFLDLLRIDLLVDGVSLGQDHAISSKLLHDPYVMQNKHSSIDLSHGMYAAASSMNDDGEQQLRDNVVMMHLLAIDESVDGSKHYQRLIASDDYVTIGELYKVDNEVNGPQRRALLVEDLQGLLDVDHLVDLGIKNKNDENSF